MPPLTSVRPQPPAAPLNDEGQQSLTLLLQNTAARDRLRRRHKNAAEALSLIAGAVNDEAFTARARHGKKLQQLEAKGEEEPEEELEGYNRYQDQVKDVTKTLDLGVRGIIDDIDWLANVPDALKAVAIKSGALAEETQRTQNTIPMTTQRSRRTADDEDEDAEMIGNDGEPTSTQLDPSDAPTALLQIAFEKRASAWNAKSLTDRYAETNEYRGFYKTLHDAKHPGDKEAPVPVPHHTMWFAAEEGRQIDTTAKATGGDDDVADSDEDIAVDHVNIRTTCPLTLKPLEDPVTSKKCPHSFERGAFEQYLEQTEKYLPFTPEQLEELGRCRNRPERTRKEKEIGTPAVNCPECNKLLAEADVESDPVLQRKVRRIEEKKQRAQEADEDSEDEDEERPRGTQRKPVGVGSSPPLSRPVSGRVYNVKAESGRVARSPLPPGTQTTTAEGATVVDLGEEDDDDDEMEDE